MLVSYNLIKIPEYNGRETSYEDIIYSFFRMALNNRGYSFKVKRTGFPEIDNIIPSHASGTRGRGSCDGYFFSTEKYQSFCGLIELESTGDLEGGITQIKTYIEGFVDDTLSDSQKEKVANVEQRDIRLIVFDGQRIYLSTYNLDTKLETVIYDRILLSSMSDEINLRLFALFPEKQKINREIEEKNLVGNIARIIRGHEKLQKNKAFIMTVLASIYGATRESNLLTAVSVLQRSQVNYENKLYQMWQALETEIVDQEDRSKLTRLYEETSAQLYELSQDRGMDLYGFIYEELATKDTKKEQGEYYTPRHTIKPLIASVFNNYLRWEKDELKEKVVLDLFCGSGGFLYEYVHFIKSKYDLTPDEINEITRESIWGFDKNGILAAELNMFLIGDGDANLHKVKTSINWRKQFLYQPSPNSKYDVLPLEEQGAIRRRLRSSLQDIQYFSKLYVSKDFQITIQELERYIGSEDLINNCIIQKLQWNRSQRNENYLGNVDLLITNVPYGKVTEATDQIIEGGVKTYGNSLEVNAVRECIDLLKPALIRNGRRIQEGGIGIIIVPDSILENATNKNIRDYLIARCDILGIVSLPEYTFSPYAMEKTYAIVIQKIAPEEFRYERNLDFRTFMYYSMCDGRANSQNRYKTNHIQYVDVKFPVNNTKRVVEFIHNDFEPCFEPYSNEELKYESKIERAWNYSTYINDPRWDQLRLRETWGISNWETRKGEKWGYNCLQRIQRQNKTIVKKASLERKIREFLEEKSEEEKNDILEPMNFDALKAEFENEVHLSPSELEVLNSLDYVEETYVLSEQKIQLVKLELIDDVDLNIDSSNYLGVKELVIRVEDICEHLSSLDSFSEKELINYFRNSFTSDSYEPVKIMDKFDVVQGTQFSKEDAYLHPGPVPVFTAATDGPAYHVKDSIIGKVKIQGPSLIWSRKGAKAGTIQIYDEKNNQGEYKEFYISDVSGVIKPKTNLLGFNLTFLKYYIAGQVKKELQSVSNNAQLNKSKLENLILYLPDNQVEIGTIIKEKMK